MAYLDAHLATNIDTNIKTWTEGTAPFGKHKHYSAYAVFRNQQTSLINIQNGNFHEIQRIKSSFDKSHVTDILLYSELEKIFPLA